MKRALTLIGKRGLVPTPRGYGSPHDITCRGLTSVTSSSSSSSDGITQSSITSYTSILKAHNGDLPALEEFAQACLQEYKKNTVDNLMLSPTWLQKDQRFFHAWLHACVLAAQAEADSTTTTTKACSIIQEQLQIGMIPDTKCYHLLLKTFLVRDDLEGATKYLLQHAPEMPEPSIVIWLHTLLELCEMNVVLPLWQRLFLGSPLQEPSLLQVLLEQGHLTQSSSIERLVARLPAEQGVQVLLWMKKQPSVQCYALVLRALAKEGKGQDAESLLAAFQQHHPSLPVRQDMLVALIVAWSNSGNVERTMHWYETLQQTTEPSPMVQSTVASCYVRAFDPRGAEQFVARVHAEQQQQQQQQKEEVRGRKASDNVLQNIVLKAWAAVPSGKRAKEYLMDTMTGKERDIVSYNTVVSAYVRERQWERAKDFVANMMEDPQCPVVPDVVTFRTLLSSKEDIREGAEQVLRWMKESPAVEVDSQTYLLVIRYVQKRPLRAEALFNEMCDSYVRGRKECRPSPYILFVVLQALVRHGQSPDRADQLLRQILSGQSDIVKPSRECFQVVIDAWVRSKDFDRATSLRKEMGSLHSNARK